MRRLLVLLLIGLCLTGEARAQLIGNPAGCPLLGCTFQGPVSLTSGGTLGGTFGGAATFSGGLTFNGSITAAAGATVTGGGALAANFTNMGRGNTYTLAGSSIDTTKMGLFNNNNCNGVSTATELACEFYSTGTISTNAPTTLLDGTNLSYLIGGAAAASAQWSGLAVSMNDSAATNDKAGGGTGAFVASQITRRASKNQGGTGLTPALSFGQNWGMDIVSSMQSGATDIGLNNVLELDLSQQSGSSVVRSAALQISHTANHAVQSSDWDYGVLMTQTPSSAPFLELFGIGGGTSPHAPLDSTGTVMGYHIAQDETATANRGIDFREVTFTTASLDLPGFQVSGSGSAIGTTKIGTLYATPSGTGVDFDAIGSVTTAMAINAGGSGYTDGVATIVDDQCGGVEWVTSSSGVVNTIVSVIRQPVCNSLSPPSTLTTVARAPSLGTGLVLTPTWDSTRTRIRLNPSAGGEVVVGSGSNMSALNVTKGFFHFPFTNATSGSGGIPTGTPASINGDACQWNDVTFTLNCYSGTAGAWKHVTFSAGAG